MSAKFSLLFLLKKTAGYVEGDLSVYMRITVNGQRTEMAIQRKISPEKWNKKKGCMLGNRDEAKELNAYLMALQTKVYEIHRSL